LGVNSSILENNAIIKVRDLTAKYQKNLILKNINLDVYKGEIFGILGGSGCGKSTLLKHMVGLKKPYSGSVFIQGVDLASCDETLFFKTLRKIGILFQGGALFGSMTLAENVALPIEEYTKLPKPVINKIVESKLNLVNLGPYMNYLPSEISHGMMKRAGLARALALNPKILFLDEPSAGLDPISSVELDQLILNINSILGTTMIIVTHELDSIFSVAKRVIMLDKTKKSIIAEGTPQYLKTNSNNQFVHNFFNRKIN